MSGEPVIALNLLTSADSAGLQPSQYLDLPDIYGCTPALLAARCAYARPPNLSGLLHCVSLCLYRGASAQAASKSDGRTVLFFLAALGAADLITQVRSHLLSTCRSERSSVVMIRLVLTILCGDTVVILCGDAVW